MGVHAFSHPVASPRRELGIFPVCLAAVALAALSPTLSMLNRPAVALRSPPAIRALAEPSQRDYTGGQIPLDDAQE